MNWNTLYRNFLTPRVILEILRGETENWTLEEWRAALIRIPILDVKKIAVHIILDHTGSLGRAVVSEVLIRRSIAKAEAIGSDCFCVYHDCDIKDCPAGEHD